MRQKSILYIITKSVWGGAAKYVYDLVSQLPKSEFAIKIASAPADQKSWSEQTPQGKFAQKIIGQNIPYYSINNFQYSVNPFKDILAFFEVLSLIYKTKPNVIHANSSKAGGIAGLAGWICRILGHKTKIIFTAHGWAFNEDRPAWQIWLIKLFSRLTAFLSDKIICVSEYDRQLAIKYKIAPAKKLIAIHNGIDIQNISFLAKKEAQKKLIHKTSPLVIGTIAEYAKNKGLIYLLEAAQHLQVKKYQFDLVLIGSGENPDKQKIKNYIQKHQLKNVHLIDYLPKAAQYLKGFDIFILPSLKEGLPYTILEAMAAQTPIIASQVGGIPEILKPDAGILIPSKNSQVLADEIIQLITHPEKARQMAQRARAKLKKEFGLEQMVYKTKGLYKIKI